MTIPEQTSGVLGLTGDINQKTNPFLATNDMYKMQGWYTPELAAISKRKGFQKLNSTILQETGVNASFTGIFEYVPSSGTSKKVATTTAGLYVYDTPAANEWNAISLTNAGGARTGTVDNLYDSAIFYDQMYIGGGATTDGNLRFDANNATPAVWNMGIAAPVTTTTAGAASAGGSLSIGTYKYKITYENVFGEESNPSVASNAITTAGGNKTIPLTAIPVSPDAQTTKRNIYRTFVDGGVYSYLATIADNSTTTFTDTFADTTLLDAVEEFAFGVPPHFSMIEMYKGVAFMSGDPSYLSRIYFSYQGRPASVDSSADYRDLDANDGEIITGLKRYLTTMVAFKGGSIWNASGDDRTTFGFDRKVTFTGSVNNACIVDVPNKGVLAFISPSGRFYFYDGVNATPTGIKIEPILNGLSLLKLGKTVGTVVPSKNQCRWIVPDGGSNFCDLMIWYDYLQDVWGTTDLDNTIANYCTMMHDATNTPQFYLGAAYNSVALLGGGTVWIGDTGGTDDGTPISVEVMDRGHPRQDATPETQKCFYHLFVWFKPIAGVTLTAYAYLDDPEGTPVSLGTVDCSRASGQDHIHFKKIGRRMYIRLIESSALQGQVLRGWKVYYKDLGRHNAP